VFIQSFLSFFSVFRG